ncbi:MAG TPA: 50S ribosomal protein L5 [Candidatus Bathyarchaeia archaeon]|nr:50S ribosomal protein L5 [Candidatus Bathyarchaeia archaeon]
MKLEEKYKKEVQPKLAEELGLKNLMAVPRLEKVIINIGLKEGAENKGALESPSQTLALIAGQKPKIARAKQSIAGFKLRAGAPIGLVVTLRGRKMHDFLEKLFKIVFPRLRDFQGVSIKSFDGHGNYSLGLPEQIVFPEVDYAKIDKVRGLEITVVTTSKSDKGAKRLLELLGMPFEKGK